MSTTAVALDHVTVRFRDYPALDDVSLGVPEGAFLSIVGPNGAGKSTLFRVLLGLVRPSAGTATVLGRAPREAARTLVGYVPQVKTSDRTFPALAVELVATGILHRWPARLAPALAKQAVAALEAVGAGALARAPLRSLSGGQLQRVFLARCLIASPRVILLDEPGTGIDVVGKADFYAVLEQVHRDRGTTVLMVTHDWQAAHYHSTHVLLLNRQVVAMGPPNDALTEANLRRAFGHEGHAHDHSHAHAHEYLHEHGAHRHD